jgi:adenosylcobinamide-GDP ribazoletransferase
VIAFLAAVQFLLVSPAFVRRAFTPRELGQAAGFYPIVGLLLGALLALANLLLGHLFPVQVQSALVLTLWIGLTGALHFDGFLDACDGLFGGSTAEHRMEIMRDERTGAYAVAGGVLLLLTLFSSLSVLADRSWAALLLAPALGRWGMTMTLVAFPYARPAGLGRDVKDHARTPQAVMATATTLAAAFALAWFLHSVSPMMALLSAGLILWISARFILRRIPGMTGDTYGAINMLIEVGVLLTFVALR